MKRFEPGRAGDAGFSLAALITFLTVMSMFVAVAVPVYTTQAQRELEEELIFRGEEYVRAIQKYQRQFGVYPPDLDSLIESNEMRFLRREYLDPITGEGFRLIKANPNGTLEGSRIYEFDDLPLFSGPLGSGTSVGGASGGLGNGGAFGTGGGGGGAGANPFAAAGGFGGNGEGAQTGAPGLPGFGQPSGGGQTEGGGFGGLSQLTGAGIPGFGQPTGGSRGQPAGDGSRGLGQPQGTGQSGFGGFGGFGQGGLGDGGGDGGGREGRDTSRSGGDGLRGTLAGSLIGAGSGQGAGQNPTGGAGPGGQAAAISGIVGVAPNNEASSLKVYNERDIYAEWEFIALPTTIAGAVQAPNLMPGDESNTGQPTTFPQGSSPLGGAASPFGQ